MKDKKCGYWTELPPELTSLILLRLGAIEILENAQKVCRSWYRICKDPSMWRKIDMRKDPETIKYVRDRIRLENMCRHVVDRSQGGLVEIAISEFGTNSLLNYIADSSSNLRSLSLQLCYLITDEGFVKAVMKLPLLEELELSYCSLLEESVNVVGKSCPNLKTFKALKLFSGGIDYDEVGDYTDDEFPIAIAESMPELRHLQFAGNELMTNTGLKAILDACPHLEHLDLRGCSNINLVGDLEKRCSKRIKVLRRPDETILFYPLL